MDQVVAHDFTGGQAARLASTQFSDRQWARLYGLVLESDAEVRTQWPWQSLVDTEVGINVNNSWEEVDASATWDGVGSFTVWEVNGEPFDGLFHADELLVGISPDGSLLTAPPPASDGSAQLTWSALPQSRPGGRLTALVPLPRDAGQGFVTSCLVNSVDMAGTAAAVYSDTGGSPALFEFTQRYPNGIGDADAMPRGNVATMWGDRLVLGDIEWLEDEAEPFSALNAIRYPNALWFSRPGQPDRWDLLDVAFMGVKDGQGVPTVVDLQPTEQGLLVLTTAGVYLLRGSPSNFDYEEVRPGLRPSPNATAGWWPGTGAAVWVSDSGEVWHSDGTTFIRIDEPLGLPTQFAPDGWVVGWDDFVLVGVGDRAFAFRTFGEGGAWTELHVPGPIRSAFVLGSSMYCLVAGVPSRLNRELEPRGGVNGARHPIRVATRTFEGGEGHRLSFWRYFGLRVEPLSEGAELTKVTLFSGPALSAQSKTMEVPVSTPALGGRDELLVPGPGASKESAVEFEFRGDISLEQVSAMFTQARGSR